MKTNEMLSLIGENIRSIRKGRKISQEQLAELSDMHPSHISDIENGKVNASLTAYYQISEALNVPLSELVKITIGSKGDSKTEAELTELFSLVRGLDKKKKALFVAASRGLLKGLENG
jgi:transcriptional regulator with XRE-family HTH domain